MGILDLFNTNPFDKYISGSFIPGAEIKVNDSKLILKNVVIISIEVNLSVENEASTCLIELENSQPNFNSGSFTLANEFASVKIGAKLEVTLGYFGKEAGGFEGKKVFLGYISNFDIEVDCRDICKLYIRGMDAKIWMMTSKKTELKKEMTNYSSIIQNTLKPFSNKLEGSEINIKGEAKLGSPVYQYGQSYFEFLSQIAEDIGHWFFISLGKLYFVSPKFSTEKTLALAPNLTGLLNIKANVGVWGIPKEVSIVTLDRKKPGEIIESKSKDASSVGNGSSISSLINNLDVTCNSIRIVENNFISEAETKFIAESLFLKRSLNLQEITVKIIGYPDIKLANLLEISGFQGPINNSYIVVSIEHNWDFVSKSTYSIIKAVANTCNKQ
ncbi:MAG: hypothetical protein RsTaC01_1079 [Candidatus Paraimprobicoccus trichonymphae]|uniref:Uncharacterized protein n=1 Tax=Candidatus Paraimprobicoccus trichonymphae TaxID=3033793 RepID=A0AA48KZQ2_9FIRM|nr:MAG: hypothetical protein RsTaC01_1079 [Candidatus Paraimprobicoccus trichonymphae]